MITDSVSGNAIMVYAGKKICDKKIHFGTKIVLRSKLCIRLCIYSCDMPLESIVYESIQKTKIISNLRSVSHYKPFLHTYQHMRVFYLSHMYKMPPFNSQADVCNEGMLSNSVSAFICIRTFCKLAAKALVSRVCAFAQTRLSLGCSYQCHMKGRH